MTDGGSPSPIVIGVSSNISPAQNVEKALRLLAGEVKVTAVSTFYWTAPLGRPEQPDFLNGACAIRTRLKPRELKFGVLRPIEARLGRVRTQDKYAPRTIDLDILVFGNVVLREPDLVAPDRELRERPFLAACVLELAPALVLPDTGEPLAQVAAAHAAPLRPDPEVTERLREGLAL